jgi:hypothetical protein
MTDNASTLHAADIFDQDKEMATLIRLFSKGQGEDQDGSSGCCRSKSMQDLESNRQNTLKRELQPGMRVLPPPSPFVRRRKSSHTVPYSPPFVEVDVEPTACKASSPHSVSQHPVPHDLYDASFDMLMRPLGHLLK